MALYCSLSITYDYRVKNERVKIENFDIMYHHFLYICNNKI